MICFRQKQSGSTRRVSAVALLMLLAADVLTGCSTSPPTPVTARTTVYNLDTAPVRPAAAVQSVQPPQPAADSSAYLLHLPGIGGTRIIDEWMVNGLIDGGFKGKYDIVDWSGDDPGINALVSHDRNKAKAAKIAQTLTEKFDADPDAKIFLSSHSGGGGIAVWALEALPPRVKVQSVLLMSPALSPGYDLTAALRHVKGKMYVFSSMEDEAVLGIGCRMFGTIDGPKTDAAGRVGFSKPPACDPAEYQKLVPMPYKIDWVKFGNMGNHIGGMTEAFGRAVLAPLLLHPGSGPTTVPVNP